MKREGGGKAVEKRKEKKGTKNKKLANTKKKNKWNH